MAYSDYGGYAYRNGARVEDRSDVTIAPDGTVNGSPGVYPGFAMLADGVDHEEVMNRVMTWPKEHVLLGDGPVYLGLFKTHIATLYRGARPQGFRSSREDFDRSEERHSAELDGHKVEVVYVTEKSSRVDEDGGPENNHYVLAKLTQPDGTVWRGWSGYGVGAGLEDADFGGDTDACNRKLIELWPESIAATNEKENS